jgi:hypothetical protein
VTTIEELAANQQNQANMLDALARSLASMQQAQQMAVMEAMVSPGSPLRAGEYPAGAGVASAGSTSPGATSMIADGAVTADTIAANAVTAGKIQAGSITTDKIAVGTDRMNLVSNGSFEVFTGGVASYANPTPLTGWGTSGGADVLSTVSTSGSAKSGQYIAIVKSASGAVANAGIVQRIPVKVGRTYRLSGWTWKAAAGGQPVQILAHSYDKAGVLVAFNAMVAVSHTTTTPTFGEATYTVPVGVAYLDVYGRWGNTPTTAEVFAFEDVMLEELPGGLKNGSANVVIDSSGITITDGALTFKDAYGSTALNGDGFGPAWFDFIKTGLYNSCFQEGPTGSVSAASIPNWTASLSSATASVDADSNWPSGRKVTVTPTAINGSLTLTSDLVPITPGTGYTFAFYGGWTVAGGAFGQIYVEAQTYAADGTTVVAAWSLAGGLAESSGANVTGKKFYSLAFPFLPTERYIRVRVVMKELTAHSASTRIYLGLVSAVTNIEANGMAGAVNVLGGDWIASRANAGAVTDGIFIESPPDGAYAIDTTNHRIYFREGGGWHYVNRTAGFQIPVDVDGVDERVCPRCGELMVVGDAVAGVLNGTMTDGALHGVWCHLRCAMTRSAQA